MNEILESKPIKKSALLFNMDMQSGNYELRPPMNKAQLEERLIRAQAYLAKFPIPLEMDEDVPEILGVWTTPASS